jgi:hypothetical protein
MITTKFMLLVLSLALTPVIAAAGNTVSNVRKNVVNISDGSSRINSDIQVNGSMLIGNGKIVSRKLKMAPFTALKVSGAFDVKVNIGDLADNEVEVSADSNLQNMIKVESRDGRLNIYNDGAFRSSRTVVIRIRVSKLQTVESSGAGTLNLHDINSESLTLRCSGAVHVILHSGAVKRLDAVMSGTAELDARAVNIAGIIIELSGSSEALVCSDGHIDVQASGVSELKYTGKAKIKQKLSGAASVSASGN